MNAGTIATACTGVILTGAAALSVWMLAPAESARPSARRAAALPVSRRGAPPAGDRFSLTGKPVPGPAATFQTGATGHRGSTATRPVLLENGDAGSEETRSDERVHHTVKSAAGNSFDSFGLTGDRFHARVLPRPPILPVVFHEAPADTVSLTLEQAAGADALQEQFLTDIGGDPADPGNRQYFEKWQHSQPVADQRLRAMIGGQAFARWQAEAYRGSRQSSPASPP